MPDPLHPTNRIEVDLKILEDRNLQRLEEFSHSWNESVTKLVDAIGDLKTVFDQQRPGAEEGSYVPFIDPLAGRRPLNAAGAVSQQASRPGIGTADEVSEGATMVIPAVRVVGAGTGPSPSASVSTAAGVEQQGSRRNQFLEAQFELGDVGQGPLAMMRYISRLMQQAPAGSRMFGLGVGAEEWTKKATIAKGAIGGLYQNAAQWTGLPPITSFMPGAGSNAAQQYGVQAGLSPTNANNPTWLGIPLNKLPFVGSLLNTFSPAGLAGMSDELTATWEGIKSSMFGGSDITKEQSLAIKKTLTEYGYRDTGMEAQHDYLQNMMTHFTKKYRGAITSEDMMQMGGDSAMRFGISSLGTLNQVLGSIGQNAVDAGYSLDVFKQSLIRAVEELQGTMPAATAAQFASNWSRDTGFLPEQAAQIAGDYKNQVIGMAMTHTDPYNATHGAKAGQAAMLGYQRFYGYAGNPENYKGIKKGDKKYQQLFDMLYWRNGGKPPEGFSSIDAFMNYMMKGGEGHVIKENQAMSALTHAHSAKEIMGWMHHGGASSARVGEFEKDRMDMLKHYMSADHRQHPTNPAAYARWLAKEDPKKYNEFLHKEKQDAIRLMHHAIQNHSKHTAAQNIKVQIGLTHQANELVKMMDQSSGGKGHSNSKWNNYGRPAIGWAEKYLQAIDPATEVGALKGLGHDIGIPGL